LRQFLQAGAKHFQATKGRSRKLCSDFVTDYNTIKTAIRTMLKPAAGSTIEIVNFHWHLGIIADPACFVTSLCDITTAATILQKIIAGATKKHANSSISNVLAAAQIEYGLSGKRQRARLPRGIVIPSGLSERGICCSYGGKADLSPRRDRPHKFPRMV